jgi:hypothetical protein
LPDNDSLDEPVISSRFFWSPGGWKAPWWERFIIGAEENCNRTFGVRLPGGQLFLCLNIPLRQTPCAECAPSMRERTAD